MMIKPAGLGELGVPVDPEAPVGEPSRESVDHDGIAVKVGEMRDIDGRIKHVQLDLVIFPAKLDIGVFLPDPDVFANPLVRDGIATKEANAERGALVP